MKRSEVLECRRRDRPLLCLGSQSLKAFEELLEVAEGVAQKARVVADVLRGCVDLVGDAGGELADRLHLLGQHELRFHGFAVGYVGADQHYAAVFVGASFGAIDRQGKNSLPALGSDTRNSSKRTASLSRLH